MLYLYMISDLTNGKKYIGVTNNYERRIKEHLSGGKHGNKEIAKVLDHDFECEILEAGTREDILAMEKEAIELLDCIYPKGYNISPGGEGGGGNQAFGSDHGLTKLTEFDVLKIREWYARGDTCCALAKAFGVEQSTITRILQGKTWKHVGGPITSGKDKRERRIRRAKNLKAQGYPQYKIAETMGISTGTVYRYLNTE